MLEKQRHPRRPELRVEGDLPGEVDEPRAAGLGDVAETGAGCSLGGFVT
jgi:hypothetical protein